MKKEKFIIEIPKEKETRLLVDREEDIKEIVLGEDKFTIIPMSELLRAKCRRSRGRRKKALIGYMESELGYCKDDIEKYHYVDFETASEEDKEFIANFNSDFEVAHERVVFSDWDLAIEILNSCVVEQTTTDLKSETALSLVREIENHSELSEQDRVVL